MRGQRASSESGIYEMDCTLNGVTIDRRGNLGTVQAKLSIPVHDSGVKIPIAFTYANRTELIKEKDVRGNIGITFDLDSLFSRAK